MNIAQHVERGRRLSPEKPALIFEGEVYTYRTLDEAANRVAGGLLRLGVGRGDRVALFLPNIPAWAFFYLGIQKIGAVAVSLNSNLKNEETGFIIDDCGAKLVVTTAKLRRHIDARALPRLERCIIADAGTGTDGEAETHREAKTRREAETHGDVSARGDISFDAFIEGVSNEAEAAEMEIDAPSAIVYTSGTTGVPKGACLSHGNVISNIEAKRRYLGIRPDDRLLLFLPLFHCFGQNAVFNSGLGAGATVVLHRQFDLTRVLESVSNDRVTMIFGVPATFILLSERASPDDMRPVRYFFSAAASLPAEIERRWREKFGRIIYQGYGLTETSPFASYNHHVKPKPGSIGTPIENVEMKVVDVDDGDEVAPGVAGEILIRGANVMLGYWNSPAATAAVIRNGWFHTGDIGRMDDEGYFYIEDRLKDMINVGGLKVYPAEVENVVYQHPSVAEVAVYGVPDALLGERVMASVVTKPGRRLTGEEIVAFCRERAADFKVPGAVEFVDSIPKNATGKVLKRVLREEKSAQLKASQNGETNGASPPAARRDAAAIRKWLVDWLVCELKVERGAVEGGKSFFDYGMDSVSVIRLTDALGHWLGRRFDATAAWNFPSVEALARHLAAATHNVTNDVSNDAANASARATTNEVTNDVKDNLTSVAHASRAHAAASPSPSRFAHEGDAAAEDLKVLSEYEIAELLDAEISAARQRKAR